MHHRNTNGDIGSLFKALPNVSAKCKEGNLNCVLTV